MCGRVSQGAVDDGDVALEAAAAQGRQAVGGGESKVSGGLEEENVAGSGEVLGCPHADGHTGGMARCPQEGDRGCGGSFGVQVLVDEVCGEQNLGGERVAGGVFEEDAAVGFLAEGLHEGEAVLLQVVAEFVQSGEVPSCVAGGGGDGQAGRGP